MLVTINTPLFPVSSQILDGYAHITGSPDLTDRHVGLAILRPRMENYTGIKGERQMLVTRDQVISYCMEHAKSDGSVPYIYWIYDCAQIASVKTAMKEHGFKNEVVLVEKYIEQETKLQTAIYTTDYNVAFIITPPAFSSSLWPMILSFISLLLPNYFKDKPLNQQEISMLQGLIKPDKSLFAQGFAQIMEPYKKDMLSETLKNCFKNAAQKRIAKAKEQYTKATQAVYKALQLYEEAIQKRDQAAVWYEGTLVKEDNEEDCKELVEHLVNRKGIHNVQFTNGVLSFTGITQLVNYEPHKWETAKRNEILNGYSLRDGNVFKDEDNRKYFLENLFGTNNPDIRVKVCGYIELWLDRNSVHTKKEDLNESDALTNPHLRLHACFGGNEVLITDCLRKGDIIPAIECSMAAIGSVNIAERELTFRPFVQQILTTDKRIIVTSDGKDLTPAEALLWLRKRDKENG